MENNLTPLNVLGNQIVNRDDYIIYEKDVLLPDFSLLSKKMQNIYIDAIIEYEKGIIVVISCELVSFLFVEGNNYYFTEFKYRGIALLENDECGIIYLLPTTNESVLDVLFFDSGIPSEKTCLLLENCTNVKELKVNSKQNYLFELSCGSNMIIRRDSNCRLEEVHDEKLAHYQNYEWRELFLE